DALHQRVPYEQQHQQYQQAVHVELAEPAQGGDVIADQGPDRAPDAGPHRPLLAPLHALLPAGTVLALALAVLPVRCFPVAGGADGTATPLGLPRVWRGPA